MPFANQILGGQNKLIRPSIQSPNFVHEVSGWTINKDGSAEFSDIVIRGTISGNYYVLNSDGFFLYSSTPAAGNLITAITSEAGTDEFGNAYSGPGIAFSVPGGAANVIQVRPDLGALLVYAA